MHGSEWMWERLWRALDDPLGSRSVYVYRLRKGRKRPNPHIWKGFAGLNLPEMLRDKFGGGDFRVLIRDGRRMVFGGEISIEAPRKKNSR